MSESISANYGFMGCTGMFISDTHTACLDDISGYLCLFHIKMRRLFISLPLLQAKYCRPFPYAVNCTLQPALHRLLLLKQCLQ
jgi:hypothetical protein